jgi:hypothetical protein
MTLTKEQLEKAMALEEAFTAFLRNGQTPEEADLGILISRDNIGKHFEDLRKMEESQQYKDFKEFLGGLSNDEFRELQAVMFIGRGDYKAAEFERACSEPGLSNDRNQDIAYIMEKAGAGNYFADGFEKLNLARMI